VMIEVPTLAQASRCGTIAMTVLMRSRACGRSRRASGANVRLMRIRTRCFSGDFSGGRCAANLGCRAGATPLDYGLWRLSWRHLSRALSRVSVFILRTLCRSILSLGALSMLSSGYIVYIGFYLGFFATPSPASPLIREAIKYNLNHPEERPRLPRRTSVAVSVPGPAAGLFSVPGQASRHPR
jgi:hypothetical protein